MSFRCFSRSSSSSFLGLRSRCSAQMWSSSEKPDCEPVLRYSSRRSSDSRSSSRRCSFSAAYSSSVSSTLLAQLVEVGGARLLVDPRHDRRGEVEDLLELLGSHVEQVADAARDALEEPDVAHGGGQVDVAHALAAHLGARDLHAAALADDALVADALVLAAVALPVLGGTEDALAEEAVLLGLERAVVDRLGLRDLAARPRADLLRGREADLDRVEIVDVDHSAFLTPRRRPGCRRSGRPRLR